LQIGGPKTIDSSTINPLLKLNDGYGLRIQDSVLSNLIKSRSQDHSLLGVLEKMKNKTFFPSGEQLLQYLLWDAKLNVIKRIAIGEKTLQALHLMALYLYTSNEFIYKQVNLSLTNWQKNTIWNSFTECLYQALHLLPYHVGEIYRGVDAKFNLDEYGIGNIITWNTFSLCSYEWTTASDLINKKTGIVFVINSKTGRNISKYSKFPVDCEVLFIPGTRFQVKAHYRAPNITVLSQANIRNTTYKIKEGDIDKAINGETCIVVELDEIIDLTLLKN
jgi:hypothetical protein